MKNGITLIAGDRGMGYFVVHDDGRYCYVQSDWAFPGLAMTFGWSPCSRCQKDCRGATNGTRGCPRRTGDAHMNNAIDWLDAHCGDRITSDPGFFEPIAPSLNHDLVRAIYALAVSYYSGQWSRGYRLLCRVKRYAERHGVNLEVKTRASQQLLKRLVKRYAQLL